jgi:hypothetical protein
MIEVWHPIPIKLEFSYFFLNNYLKKLYYKTEYIQSYMRNFPIFDSHACIEMVI